MSVKENKTKFLVSINNIDDIEKYKKVGITTFLFALKDYSIGYENTFDVETINNVSEKKYVLLNRVLDTTEIESVKEVIKELKCDGIVFEDIGLINYLSNFKLDKILFMNHFNCNHYSINEWLEYVDSVVLSNELTYQEYESITKYVNKMVVLNLFGYNQIMYSKRTLLTNFNKNFNDKASLNNEIKDKNGNTVFKIVEQENETVVLSSKIFDGRRLLDLDNVKYFYLNTSFINTNDVIDFINGKKIDNLDEGFLDKPTIYKLKGGSL